jgi:amino acid transporter
MVSTALINGSLGFIKNDSSHSISGSRGAGGMINCREEGESTRRGEHILATVSRQTFAFARDDALPFSKQLAHVNRRTQIPKENPLAGASTSCMSPILYSKVISMMKPRLPLIKAPGQALMLLHICVSQTPYLSFAMIANFY